MDSPNKTRLQEEEEAYKTQKMFYCKSCLSLHIIQGRIVDYCAKCGSADLGEVTLEEYDLLYEKKYKKKFFKK